MENGYANVVAHLARPIKIVATGDSRHEPCYANPFTVDTVKSCAAGPVLVSGGQLCDVQVGL